MQKLRKRRLVEYLQAIDQNEWKPLREFILYKNKNNKDAKRLFQHFYKYKDQLNHERTSIEYINDILFPSKTRKTILNIYSSLTEEVKQYFISEELSKDQYMQQVLLLQALNRKRLYDQSNKLVKLVNKQLDNEKIGLWNSYYRQLMHHHHYFSENIKHYIPKHKVLQVTIDSAQLHHQQMRSLYKLEINNSINLNRAPYKSIIDDFILEDDHSDEVSQIFFSLSEVVTKKDGERALSIENKLMNKHHKMSGEVKLIIYIILRSFYARQANHGKKGIAQKIFDLQKFMIAHQYLNFNNQITSARFIMITELSAFLGEWRWAKEFVKNSIHALPSEHRSIVHNIAKALILYSQQKYEDCLHLLSTIYPKNIILKSVLIRLQLITYLELYEEDKFFLKNQLENYRLFYIRNKKSMALRVFNGSINLYKIINMIVRDEPKQKIISKIQSMKILFFRLYLFNKLEKDPG